MFKIYSLSTSMWSLVSILGYNVVVNKQYLDAMWLLIHSLYSSCHVVVDLQYLL